MLLWYLVIGKWDNKHNHIFTKPKSNIYKNNIYITIYIIIKLVEAHSRYGILVGTYYILKTI